MTDSEKVEKLEIDYWARLYEDSMFSASKKYTSFYRKNPNARIHITTAPILEVGKYIDLEHGDKILLESVPERPIICINSGERVIDKKRLHESNVVIVYEAAIKTYPTKNAIEFIEKWLDDNLPQDLKDIKYSDVGISGYMRIIDNIFAPNEDEEISPMIQLMIPYYSGTRGDAEFLKLIRKLSDDLYVYGYMYSSKTEFDVPKQPLTTSDITVYAIAFEARYTELKVDFDKKLYHVVPMRILDKIRKNGIVPRCGSTEFKYPERVYLFNKAKLTSIENYGKTKSPEGFCILSIDSEKLKNDPQYKSGKMRFYLDPAFTPTDDEDVRSSMAVFTYSNIRPELIDNDIVGYVPDGGSKYRKIKGTLR